MKTMFTIFVIAFVSVLILSAADDKGITTYFKDIPMTVQLDNVNYDAIKEFTPQNNIYKNGYNDKLLIDETWRLLDSVNINSYIMPKANLGVRFYPLERYLHPMGQYELPESVTQAIDKAPKWIRMDLKNTFTLLPEAKQLEYAAIINDATDPFIDEIAFAIAKTSPNFLTSQYCFKELFLHNAQLLYEHDADLDYVEIVDYGTSADDDYYSTTKYWKIDADSQKVQIEVPREIYYWFIVHPKLSDEIPTYIKPDYIECNPDQSNHTLNIVAPPEGVFWRDFLYTHTEELPDTTDLYYPILKEQIADCEVLWDDTNENKSAVKTITKWVNDVMNFTSKAERPHQPVRIYSLHIGRCGEHEDITNATSRTCLIPCRGISTMSTDHVWNEFWDEKWEQWEPVNNSHKNKMAYSNRKYGTVFARRSDGVLEFVTKEYEKTGAVAEMNLYVLDNHDKPIDGALVILYASHQDTVQYPNSAGIDSYSNTDNDGKCTFIIGTKRKFFCRVISQYGNFPPEAGYVAGLVEYPDSGRTYNMSARFTVGRDEISFNSINLPEDGVEDFVIEGNFSVSSQAVNWSVAFDDFSNYYTFWKKPAGKVNFFISDIDQFNCCEDDEPFDACFNQVNTASLNSMMFNVPSENKSWVTFLNNGNCNRNFNIIDATFKLYASPTVGIEEYTPGGIVSEYKVFPNPFSSIVNINYTLTEHANVTLDIFNNTGKLVFSARHENQSTGSNTIQWSGTDIRGNELNSGIYFYQLSAGNQRITNKLVLIK
ncbi:T9SS type A sorting domain-containing protein [Bacteroidota bacterium]